MKVALAIVAISLAAGSRAASSVVDTSQRLSDVVLAQWCADNQLTELRLAGQLPAVGKAKGAWVNTPRRIHGSLEAVCPGQPRLDGVTIFLTAEGGKEISIEHSVQGRGVPGQGVG